MTTNSVRTAEYSFILGESPKQSSASPGFQGRNHESTWTETRPAARCLTDGFSRLTHPVFVAFSARGMRQHGLRLFVWVLAVSSLLRVPDARADASDATSGRVARSEAMRAIPWTQLSTSDRHAAQSVVRTATIYRRLPTRIIDCDPELFSFLVQHPEVVVDCWRVMGISQVVLERVGAGCYRGTDGVGTTGTVRFLHGEWGPEARISAVILAEGDYEGPPFVAPIKAQSLLLLRSGAFKETNGRYYVTVRVDSFLKLEQVGVELVAKTVQPWIAKNADQNLIETLSFVSNFSRTAETNPHGMQRLATKLATVDDATRAELVRLSFRAAERYAHHVPFPASKTNALAQKTPIAVSQVR